MSIVAFFVDGGFYRKRMIMLKGTKTPAERANELFQYCCRHLYCGRKRPADELHKIFYYDCPPSDKTVFHPLLRRGINLRSHDVYGWTNSFFDELRKTRKVALRLGRLSEEQLFYTIKPQKVKELYTGKVANITDLEEEDFVLTVTQKGVDMKLGTDIATLSYKKIVNKIVLISGDSDFVPAAKLARREGIDFVLDPLWSHIRSDLYEHIDGIKTCCPKPTQA